jgi:hypothetical protein
MTPEPDATPEQTLAMPVVADTEATETLEPVPETEVLPALPEPEPVPAYLSDFGQQAEAQFLEWVDAYQAGTRADWDQQIGTLDGQRPGAGRNRIFGNLDAGMLACRRIAAQAVLAALPAGRPVAVIGGDADAAPVLRMAPLPAIEGLPRHSHRRTGGAA